MEQFMWLISLVSALLGAAVGGYATYYFNNRHVGEVERTNRANLAKALRVELSTLWDIHMDINGKDIEKANEEEPPPIGILKSNQNYFVVFDNSSDLLGLLDSNVAEKVVKTYVNAKAFFDELIDYGKLADRNYEAQLEAIDMPESYNEKQKTYSRMQRSFPLLKERHFEIKKLIGETTSILDSVG